jgi:GTP pyrophosphokinase
MNNLERAIALAVDAHAGQTDKAGKTYIRHPLRIMQQMETPQERVVAVLHDVVEDTEYTPAMIEEEFGEEIRDAIVRLTKQDGESYFEFVERASANDLAQKVKIADIEDNMDLTRLSEVSEKTVERQMTYHRALQQLRSE